MVAEWGTAIQPACFSYDEADRLTSLTTFRGAGETIESDPRNRTDGDTTTWTHHDTTGLELCKTYADGSQVVKTYDAFNRLAMETDARGVVKTHTYDPARGLLLSTTYSDGTAPREYAYDYLGNLTQVTDNAGTRTFSYNTFGENLADELLADGVTHTITEQRDEFGRSTGYVYAKNGTTQQTVTTGYAEDGRISTVGFMHGGSRKSFEYAYLPGSNLLEKLTMPNNMTLTQGYEAKRDLLTGMTYMRSDALVTQRSYSYDALGRPTQRDTQYPGKDITHSDTFEHNSRAELVNAQLDDALYAYTYDNIGNRETAQEAEEEETPYEANALNQYTVVGDFSPEFDLAGNQTLMKTGNGIWRVTYNAENRPTTFISEDGSIVVECAYDYMGRRSYKRVITNGAVTLHQRYLYRGYLQIAACDLTRTASPCLWLISWDPTQSVATRPLAIQKDGVWYAYGWDLTKNITELYGQTGYIRTLYTYTPYGAVSDDGDVSQPIQWNSEYYDAETALIYYNYRYYNAYLGRWISKDLFTVREDYCYVNNFPCMNKDILGLTGLPSNDVAELLKNIDYKIYISRDASLDDPKKFSAIFKDYKTATFELLKDKDTPLSQCFYGQYESWGEVRDDVSLGIRTTAWVKVTSFITSKIDVPQGQLQEVLAPIFDLYYKNHISNEIGRNNLNLTVSLSAAYPVAFSRGAQVNWRILDIHDQPSDSRIAISDALKIKDGSVTQAQYGVNFQLDYIKDLTPNTNIFFTGGAGYTQPLFNKSKSQCEFNFSVGVRIGF